MIRWWEYWRETICMTIIYICIVASVVCYAIAVYAIGREAVHGAEVVKNVVGCTYFAGCGVGVIWCFVGMIRA